MDSLASVAAPLLAGFSLTTIAIIAQEPQHIRWPGVSVVVFAGTGLLLIFSVQAGYHARAFLYSPGDIDNWWPDHKGDVDRRQWLHETHAHDLERWRVWSTRSRRCYNVGSMMLLIALATIAAPPSGARQAELCWIGSAVVLVGAVFAVLAAAHRLGLIRRWHRRS